jgi:hypothetical protein
VSSPFLIHNLDIFLQVICLALENLRPRRALWAPPRRCPRPWRTAEHDPLV